jgi:hypothetical protein
MRKSFVLPFLFAAAAGMAGIAHASGNRCEAVPREQWQPVEALTQKLQASGLKVLKTKVEKGCYEVYAVDATGMKTETSYHPKTLEPVAR